MTWTRSVSAWSRSATAPPPDKKPSLANRRLAFDRLRDREMVVKLFDELGPRFSARNGGYLRILKYGFRDGDNAPMALIEMVDRAEDAGVVEAAE